MNVVGAGGLGTEIALDTLATHMSTSTVRYDPDTHHGLYIRFAPSGGLITIYRTGSYHIVGVKSIEEMHNTSEQFLHELTNLGIDYDDDAAGVEVRNLVGTATYLDSLDLNAVAIALGLEQVEYEPEQFPGLIYRPRNRDGVYLLFNSGEMVIMGLTTVAEIEAAYYSVVKTLDRSLS